MPALTATDRILTGALAGAAFRFQTNAPDLAAYAQRHLSPLLLDTGAAPAVNAVLTWHEGQPPTRGAADVPTLGGMERVDRDIYVDGAQLLWFRVDDLRDLFLRFHWQGDRLDVRGDFYYRLGNSELSDRIRRLRRWSQLSVLRARRFTTLLYYLVYYPCWWWLEHARDLHPIHAAGVVMHEGTVVLAGPSGVGKSTLAVALAAAGGRILSDSFVLHSGPALCGVREPVLLDEWSHRWLGPYARDLEPVAGHFSLNRQGYQVPARDVAGNGRAGLLVFPRRTTEAFARQISAEQAHQELSAADMIINDLRRYWGFAAVLEQLAPRGLMARREANLARLAAEIPCFHLGLSPQTTCAEAVSTITRLMRDKPLRAVGS